MVEGRRTERGRGEWEVEALALEVVLTCLPAEEGSKEPLEQEAATDTAAAAADAAVAAPVASGGPVTDAAAAAPTAAAAAGAAAEDGAAGPATTKARKRPRPNRRGKRTPGDKQGRKGTAGTPPGT